MSEPRPADSYDGFLGAIRYAFRVTDSRLCRAYIVVGTLVAALVAVLFALGVVTLIGGGMGDPGGLLTSARAFYVVIALFCVGPLLAPTLLVARRHRQDRAHVGYDRAMAATGFLFLASLYVGLAVSMPPEYESSAEGAFAPVIELLNAVPDVAWPLFPISAAALMLVVTRLYR